MPFLEDITSDFVYLCLHGRIKALIAAVTRESALHALGKAQIAAGPRLATGVILLAVSKKPRPSAPRAICFAISTNFKVRALMNARLLENSILTSPLRSHSRPATRRACA